METLEHTTPTKRPRVLHAVLAVLALAVALRVAAEAARPNIIVVFTDDQQFRAIGYNNPDIQTPNTRPAGVGGPDIRPGLYRVAHLHGEPREHDDRRLPPTTRRGRVEQTGLREKRRPRAAVSDPCPNCWPKPGTTPPSAASRTWAAPGLWVCGRGGTAGVERRTGLRLCQRVHRGPRGQGQALLPVGGNTPAACAVAAESRNGSHGMPERPLSCPPTSGSRPRRVASTIRAFPGRRTTVTRSTPGTTRTRPQVPLAPRNKSRPSCGPTSP